jgi:hypothetical protein
MIDQTRSQQFLQTVADQHSRTHMVGHIWSDTYGWTHGWTHGRDTHSQTLSSQPLHRLQTVLDPHGRKRVWTHEQTNKTDS